MVSAVVLLVVFLLLVALNFLFVAVEFSLLTLDRNDLRRRVEDGDPSARAIERAVQRTSTNLSGAQLGITLTSLIGGYLTGPSFGVLITALLGLVLPEAAAVGIATVAAFLIATITQMVFGELVPKNWALANAYTVAKVVVMPMRIFMILFGWLVAVLNGAANAVLRALGFTPEEEVSHARTAEELAAVVRRSAAQGTLHTDTAELVQRSIDFGDRTAADVMRPRPQVEFLAEEDTAQDVLVRAAERGYSRFPVTGEDLDDIRGIVHFKDAVAIAYHDRPARKVADIMREAQVVPESMPLDGLLTELRRPGVQMALVVDEYGGTAGIVTLEDLLEELVGEIDDEHDVSAEMLRVLDADSWEASGMLRPDELGDLIDLELPEGNESDTIGGLLTERLERFPEPGDSVLLECTDEVNRDERGLATPVGLRLTALSLDGYRVDRIRVTREELPTEDEETER